MLRVGGIKQSKQVVRVGLLSGNTDIAGADPGFLEGGGVQIHQEGVRFQHFI